MGQLVSKKSDDEVYQSLASNARQFDDNELVTLSAKNMAVCIDSGVTRRVWTGEEGGGVREKSQVQNN